jgi:hypothetical protein
MFGCGGNEELSIYYLEGSETSARRQATTINPEAL